MYKSKLKNQCASYTELNSRIHVNNNNNYYIIKARKFRAMLIVGVMNKTSVSREYVLT